jgi:hypothetical protein
MTFGLITEGLTDQVVLSSIVRSIVNHSGQRAQVTALAPLDTNPHGYTKVFDYIRGDIFRELLVPEDAYVVIQIDTDTRDKWPEFFQLNAEVQDILKQILSVKGDSEKEINALIENVSALLKQLIGQEYYESHKAQILFAICIHEMECWVLPYRAQKQSDLSKITKCTETLSRVFTPDGYYLDPNKKGHDNSKYYRLAIKNMQKRKDILAKYHHNRSLHIFVDRLLAFDN